MDKLKDINEVIKSKELNTKEAELSKECMIELCKLCDVQKSLTKLSDVFLSLSDAILIFDLDLNLVDSNKKGQAFLAEQLDFEYDLKKYKLKELPILDISSQEKTIKVISFNTKKERKIFNISSSITYSASSQPVGICMVVNEVTEIEKQIRQMEDMMASFTHDLKTPLIALETNIEHILDGEYGELDSKLRQLLNLMLKSSSNTLRLVRNLLTVLKYDTRSYKLLPKNIKAREVINSAIATVEPLLNSKEMRVTMDLESDFSLFCDPFEIERVLMNLLSNSIKYSPEKSPIGISLSKQDGFYFICVDDSGFGIKEEQLATLFDRFWQAKIYNTNTNGTGLGLYLSRQIIEAHGGSIWAEAKKGKGTKICFKLPINTDSAIQQDLETKSKG